MFSWSLKGSTKYLTILKRELDCIRQHKCFLKKSSGIRKIQRPPMERNWKPPLQESSNSYRLLSYNILAQELLTDNMFLYYDNDPKFLSWKYRIGQLGLEVNKLQPDIMCLQEVQHVHLKEMVRLFGARNSGPIKLEYSFKKRTGTRCDGCAILYDKSKFKLIEDSIIEYYDEGCSISNRENIALMAKFALRSDPATTFVVVTTHLLYNPRRHDVRVSQISKLIRGIIKFSKDPTKDTHRLPVILTGDFNCTPDSTPFRMLTTERRAVVPAAKEEKEEHFLLESIHFGSDCASTFQNQWIVVDYILKSCAFGGEKTIQINSTYNLPNVISCQSYGKIPNKNYGSDHFSLAIQFSII
uniref:Endonuclease/exonuclease/phosphatase domain-containing protein n=1 Tax=Stomoxys calcitrans TaxID=35570 RepID=A0A1I8P9I4_STOCA